MKIQYKILILLLLFISIISGLIYDSYYIAPKRFIIRYETASSVRIPKELNDINILFFSDLHYGLFMDDDRLQSLIKTINSSSPDVVIFGGDLINGTISEENKQNLIGFLKGINAPLGKFAVYGDYDISNIDLVNEILSKSNFEVLNNKGIQLRNKGSQSINLIGLNNEDSADLNINQAYENVVRTAYTITVCHTPDTANKIPRESSDLYLTGHSLGGQVFYLFDSLYKPDFTSYYFRGKHKLENKINIDVSSGTGTIIKDIRFLSNAEVVVYRLKNLEVQEASQ